MLWKTPAPGNRDRPITLCCPRSERVIAAAAFLVVLVVRVIYCFRLHVDSDEPQHLHVAWQWSQGLVAYRDFFDNHTPLFHILMAPVLTWIGERADVVDLARLFMVPFFVLALWGVRCLGRALFSERVGLWAPVFAAAYPKYMFPMVEFRADILWASVWVAFIAVLLAGHRSVLRSFSAGLLAGICLSASMKTGLLAGTLAGAATVTILFAPGMLSKFKPARFAANLIAGLTGLAVVPGLLVVYFARQGALDQLIQCVFKHNILPAGMIVENRPPSWLLLTLAFLIAMVAARFLFGFWGADATAFRRTIVFLHVGFTMAILKFVWPVLTRQNDLPVYPLAVLLLSVPAISLAERTALRFHRASPAATLACLVGTMTVSALFARPITLDLTLPSVHLIGDALRLTAPGEYVMSYKGEPIFRRRPYYYVLEPFTRARLRRGLLPDEIAERLIATRTCVAMTLTHRLPIGARTFLEDNYIPVGPLRVVGQQLPKPDAEGNIRFEIEIPADYTLLLENGGDSAAQLDGKLFSKSSFIDAGEHVLHLDAAANGATLLWTRAVQLGFKPMPPGYQPENVGTEF